MRKRGKPLLPTGCLIIINGGAATTVLAYYGAHIVSAPGKSAILLTIILYCLGVLTAIFAGLYVRRTVREWPSTGLLVFSEGFFLAASLCLALSSG